MVLYRESQSEQPPLSRILPHLYLGAESDVTQDCLSTRGISYVLSVSRCCPQPSFVLQSQYLRIPIDDSLRDDLLPWIPQALRFIDGAMSLGCSVIVHCAAGISRSPALVVAYVMYSLGMDLEHAYRFVKERRPTISPNFNFLGQLQLFQNTLPLKNKHTDQPTHQPVTSSDACLQNAGKTTNNNSTLGLFTNNDVQESFIDSNWAVNRYTKEAKGDVHCENKNIRTEAAQSPNPKPEFTLSLSEKLRALTLSVEPVEVPRAASVVSLAQQDVHTPTASKPSQLQIPSFLEKRKTLTLSLTPICPSPKNHQKGVVSVSSDFSQSELSSIPAAHRRRDPSAAGLNKAHRSSSREAFTKCTNSRSQKRRSERKNSPSLNKTKEEQPRPKAALPKEQRDSTTAQSQRKTQSRCNTASHQRASEMELAGSAVEAVEGMTGDQSPLSPINLTINRLLGWGERMLLGVLLGPHIKVGQAALPYKC
ncbi:dual specificity protein phosphatase 8 [Electrophorus electricus]|uniref:protein-tyrosine-phosphatase n=1 Tax=Electrophorus electricus TaxID=8005 RepID=A0A4W4G6Y8_ELEEL|nr:dual specificity protein phosphatase 8 [Electrophorus electricus]